MSDNDNTTETTNENDGRSIKIDTGYYSVLVEGDTDDSLDDVEEKAMRAADRAKEDIEELDDDGDNTQFQ